MSTLFFFSFWTGADLGWCKHTLIEPSVCGQTVKCIFLSEGEGVRPDWAGGAAAPVAGSTSAGERRTNSSRYAELTTDWLILLQGSYFICPTYEISWAEFPFPFPTEHHHSILQNILPLFINFLLLSTFFTSNNRNIKVINYRWYMFLHSMYPHSTFSFVVYGLTIGAIEHGRLMLTYGTQ